MFKNLSCFPRRRGFNNIFRNFGEYDPFEMFIKNKKKKLLKDEQLSRVPESKVLLAEKFNISSKRGTEFHPVNIELLRHFVSPTGAIYPKRITGLTNMQQVNLAKAIKSSRMMGFMTSLKRPDLKLTRRELKGYVTTIHPKDRGLPDIKKTYIEDS